MSEPKVEIDLNSIQSTNIELLKALDDIRRWYEFREDVKTPSMQLFEGIIPPTGSLLFTVTGKVCGATGSFEEEGLNNTTYWRTMFSDTTVRFSFDVNNALNNTVRIVNDDSEFGAKYKVTVFYRGNLDGN